MESCHDDMLSPRQTLGEETIVRDCRKTKSYFTDGIISKKSAGIFEQNQTICESLQPFSTVSADTFSSENASLNSSLQFRLANPDLHGPPSRLLLGISHRL